MKTMQWFWRNAIDKWWNEVWLNEIINEEIY